MTTSEVVAKASRCKKLLDDPDLQQAFQDVRNALHTQFDQIKPTDTEAMVKIKERLHLLESVEQNLKAAIRDGQLEIFRADEQERPPYLGDISKWMSKHRK